MLFCRGRVLRFIRLILVSVILVRIFRLSVSPYGFNDATFKYLRNLGAVGSLRIRMWQVPMSKLFGGSCRVMFRVSVESL